MIPEGHVTLDSILEGILDEEQSETSSPASRSASSSPSSSSAHSSLLAAAPIADPPMSTILIGSGSPEVHKPNPGALTLGQIQDFPCISIKTELADSCSMDIMMEYDDTQTSSSTSPTEIKLFQSLTPTSSDGVLLDHHSPSPAVTPSSLPLQIKASPSPGSPDRQNPSSTTMPIIDSPRLISADSIKEEDSCPKRMCLVCGDIASGFHYGVSSCEACKAFFKRTIQGIANRQGNIEYTCPASNDCEINKRRRKACQACRFQKCLRMGMLKEGVRLDRVRGGRQKYRRVMENPHGSVQQNRKLSLEDNKMLTSLIQCEPEPLFALANSNLRDADEYKILSTLSEFYERELVGTIGWAKQIPGFTDLSLNDQMRLLQDSWPEILTLSLVFRSLSGSGKLNFASDFSLNDVQAKKAGMEDLFVHCIRTTERLERIGIRKEEFLLLKAIVISNCDVKVEEYSNLWSLRDNLLSSLYDCVAVIRTGNPTIQVQNLLLLLPSIRQADSLVRNFWKSVQKSQKISLNKLLVEMLEPADNCD